MAVKKNDGVPPVPVPPIESAPAAATPPVPATPPNPVTASAPPNPYAAPAQPAAPVPGSAYGATAPGPTPSLSVAAMVSGIVAVLASFGGLGLLPAIAAVVLGHLAQRRQPQARPFWITGLITGYIALGITVVTGLVIALIVLFAAGAFLTAVPYLG